MFKKNKKNKEMSLDDYIVEAKEASDKQELIRWNAEDFVRDVVPMLRSRMEDKDSFDEFSNLLEQVGQEFYTYRGKLWGVRYKNEDLFS